MGIEQLFHQVNEIINRLKWKFGSGLKNVRIREKCNNMLNTPDP